MNKKEYTLRKTCLAWLVGHTGGWKTSFWKSVWLDKAPGFKVLFSVDTFSLPECLLKAFRGRGQDDRVRERGAHLPPWTHQKYIYIWNNSHWKLTENWQKDSCTTKAVRKIHT